MQTSTPTTSTMIATVLAGPAGVDFGNFAGADEAAILDAYAVEMGYASFAALADALEQTVEQCRAELVLLDPVEAAIGGSTSISVLEVGPSSAVDDVEGCVDATVRIGAAEGTVTLVPNAASGELEPYGDNLWMWAEPSLHAAIEADERMVDRVVAEVKAAL